MELKQLTGLEFMGDNVRSMFKYCGEDVRLYPLCKILRAQNVEIDDHSRIFDFAFIDAGESLKIGKYSFIMWHCLIEGGAKVKIGNRVFVGPGTKILSSTYKFNEFYTAEFLPEGCHDIEYGDIELKDDSYIGANAVIMPGITIGEGAVVGSNAFVNKDVEPWGIYVGSPARKVGDRKKPTEERRAIVEQMDWINHFDI